MDYAQGALTPQQSKSCTEVPHANVRPLLESVWEMLMSVIDGRNSSPAFATLDRDGSWLKTCLGSYQLTLDGSLEKYCEPWPKQGTLLDGNAGELPMLERRTEGNGCSLSGTWSTPTAIDHATENMKSTQQKSGSNHSLNLPSAVHAQRLWPTPNIPNGGRVNQIEMSPTGKMPNGKKRQVDMGHAVKMVEAGLWPTPKASLRGDCLSERAQRNPDSNSEVKMWNTPVSQDAKNSTLPQSQGERNTIPGDLIRDGAKGQLNPAWVETLMGYEPGWTELPENWKRKSGRRSKAKRNTNGSRQE